MKARLDFVSNSSYSSYIISSTLSSKRLGAKLFQCYKNICETKYDWINAAGKKLSQCLYDHSALTIFDITFDIPLTDEQKKQFYDGESKSNLIYGGRCCNDKYMKSLFDRFGKVKDGVDYNSIIDMLSWYKIKNGNIKFYDDDEDPDEKILVSNSGKITKKTVDFNRWLIKALEKKYPEIHIHRKQDFLDSLDRVEHNLNDYFMYYLRVNHDGDGVDDDAAYYSNYRTTGDYFDALYRAGVVVEMDWMKSM